MFEIGLDKDALEHIKKLKYAKRELGRALAYFSRAVATAVGDEVARMGRVPGVDYDSLDVVYFGKTDGFNVSALVLPESMRAVTEEDSASVVTVSPSGDSEFVKMLEMQSPWPPSMLPPGFQRTKKARLVLRKVSVEEVEAQVARLLKDRDVYQLLLKWKYISPASPFKKNVEDLMERAVPPDLRVQEDIAWKVLRHEFGLGGNPSVPHWRKAIQGQAVNLNEEVLYGFWETLLGERREGIPRKNISLMSEMGAVETFQEYVTSKGKADRGDPRK